MAVTTAAALPMLHFAIPVVDPSYEQAVAEQARWIDVDFDARTEVQLLRNLIAIDTSHPDPREVDLADRIAERLASQGIDATVERFTDGRANLWAIVEGEDPRAVVLHGHLDVEPLQDDGEWTYPPLSGAIDGPWIYGRGIYDMKSLLAAELLAFEAVARAARSGRRPARSLMLLFTSSEEIGSDTGTVWILAEHPELVRRMDTVLTEGGVVEATSPTEIKYWGIEFAQKRFAHFAFCSADRGAIEDLHRKLITLGPQAPLPTVPPEVRIFLAAYGPTRSLSVYHELLAEPDRLPLEPARFDQLSLFQRALFQDVVFAWPPERDPGGGWRLRAVAHVSPDNDLATVLAAGAPDWLIHGVARTEPRLVGADHGSPVDHPDFRAIREEIAARHPGTVVGPYYLPVTATDSRFFRASGIRSYGIQPFGVMPTETTGIARPNERMSVPAYLEGVELLVGLVSRLVESPAAEQSAPDP